MSAEEVDKRGAGVAWHGLTEHLAGFRVERRQEREGAMPVVLEPVPLGTPGRQWQDRIEAIEGLDGRFLIDGEDRRVIGRIDVQPNHVSRLGLEVRVVRLHVAFEPMRLQPARCHALATRL
jgi:hypothetical protein